MIEGFVEFMDELVLKVAELANRVKTLEDGDKNMSGDLDARVLLLEQTVTKLEKVIESIVHNHDGETRDELHVRLSKIENSLDSLVNAPKTKLL